MRVAGERSAAGGRASSLAALLLIPALFGGFFGHISAVVAATVTATSEVSDAHKALATGLVTTSQRVAVTVGIPILGAVMAIRADLLSGIRLALAADVLHVDGRDPYSRGSVPAGADRHASRRPRGTPSASGLGQLAHLCVNALAVRRWRAGPRPTAPSFAGCSASLKRATW